MQPQRFEDTSDFMDSEPPIAYWEDFKIFPNRYPITFLHLLLATDHRGDIRVDDLVSALRFARTFPDYLVFLNRVGAGASFWHTHFQCMLRGHEALPIELAPRQIILQQAGMTISQLESYPMFAVAVSGPRAAQVVYAFVQELEAEQIPFNLVVLPNAEIVIIPRGLEQPPGFPKVGGPEVAGMLILTDATLWEAVTFTSVWAALQTCSISPAQAQALVDWFTNDQLRGVE